MLKSALLRCLERDDWTAKVHIISEMLYLPLDYQLTNTVAQNLNDIRWPVRLMTIFTLAKSQNKDFARVLDWTAQRDPNILVRDMAIALSPAAATPQPTNLLTPDSIEILLHTNED